MPALSVRRRVLVDTDFSRVLLDSTADAAFPDDSGAQIETSLDHGIVDCTTYEIDHLIVEIGAIILQSRTNEADIDTASVKASASVCRMSCDKYLHLFHLKLK